MNSTNTEYQQEIAEMYADADFMAWLKQHDTDFDCAYSGNLLDMFDAFKAGRALKENKTP